MESDFSHVDYSGEICDISQIHISQELSTPEKSEEYIRQTGSSTHHKVGAVEVECIYGDTPIEKMLHDLIFE